jgi:hypothetical protein
MVGVMADWVVRVDNLAVAALLLVLLGLLFLLVGVFCYMGNLVHSWFCTGKGQVAVVF